MSLLRDQWQPPDVAWTLEPQEGIPILDPTMQLDALVLPVMRWGRIQTLLAILLLAPQGCSDYSPPCPPDGVDPCVCSTGEHGERFCLIQGWSACSCPSQDAGDE